MFGYWIMDKTTFEGMALTLALEDWTRKILVKAHYDKNVADEQAAAQKLVDEKLKQEGEKIIADKINRHI